MNKKTQTSKEVIGELLTSEEVGARLRIKPSTLKQWASRRVGVAFIKIGKHRYYSSADVESFINSKKVSTIDQE